MDDSGTGDDRLSFRPSTPRPMMAMAVAGHDGTASFAHRRRRAAPRLHLPSYPSTSSTIMGRRNAPWLPRPVCSNLGAAGMPPIGRPIAGASIYLLNENGEQVPDGTGGRDLHRGRGASGAGIATCPMLPSEASCMILSQERQAARMYRTGDRGVRRPDGRNRISRTPRPADEDPRTPSRTG